jgi:hypothetical protein
MEIFLNNLPLDTIILLGLYFFSINDLNTSSLRTSETKSLLVSRKAEC